MEKLYQLFVIGDIQEIPDKGLALVGGLINNDLDPTKLRGEEIYIKSSDGQITSAEVLDSTIFSSLIDKKNIALLVSLNFKGLINEGAVVYCNEDSL